MRKINKTLYYKLFLQGQEAKHRGLNKVASGIFQTIGSMPEDDDITYSYDELNSDIYNGLWKLAGNVMQYYDVQSVDAEKIHYLIESLASEFIGEIEGNINLESFDLQISGETK